MALGFIPPVGELRADASGQGILDSTVDCWGLREVETIFVPGRSGVADVAEVVVALLSLYGSDGVKIEACCVFKIRFELTFTVDRWRVYPRSTMGR